MPDRPPQLHHDARRWRVGMVAVGLATAGLLVLTADAQIYDTNFYTLWEATTLLAGEYWLIKAATGATLANQTMYVARLMLLLTNVLPLAAALVMLARLIDRLGEIGMAAIYSVTALAILEAFRPAKGSVPQPAPPQQSV